MNQYVVGLCGSHGTGKSTILQAIKRVGIPVDESTLSRTAQASLGWENLKPAQESQENMWELQDAILEALVARDRKINESKIVTLVDRTPADVWGYVQLWMDRLEKKGETIDLRHRRRYFGKITEAAENYRCQIYVPIRDEIAFVEEPNRADVQSRLFHATAVEDFLTTFGYRHDVVKALEVDNRVIEVSHYMKRCYCR